ncbi:MAG TPA: TetR/AcrR family transcriptional regulator [Smithella sp.]|nr:TetR/AcrR family transcriptional regulator [Smithella sp.]
MTEKKFTEIKLKEKENRRLALLQIAENILHENCLEDVTIRNVADKAGLSVGAIYMYFTSKEELLLAILIRQLKKLQSELESLKDIDDPLKALRAMALAYRDYFTNYGKYIDVFRHLTEKEGKELISQDNKNELLESLGAIFAFIEELVSNEKFIKYFKGIPPRQVVPMVWSIVHGVSQITLSTTRGETVGFVFDQVIDNFIHLISEGCNKSNR